MVCTKQARRRIWIALTQSFINLKQIFYLFILLHTHTAEIFPAESHWLCLILASNFDSSIKNQYLLAQWLFFFPSCRLEFTQVIKGLEVVVFFHFNFFSFPFFHMTDKEQCDICLIICVSGGKLVIIIVESLATTGVDTH